MLLMLHYCSSSLLLVLEFESGRGEILNLYEYLYAKKKKGINLLREGVAWVGTIRRESTWEERSEIFSR